MGWSRARFSGRPPVRHRARWRTPRVGVGSTSKASDAVSVQTDLRGLVNGTVQDVADAVGRVAGEYLQEFFREVQRTWPQPGNAPTATGYSVTQLGLDIDVSGFIVQWRLTNRAFYAGMIRQAQHGRQLVHKRVVFEPAMVMTRKLAQAIADELGR